jgi:hypothetical protein
MRPSKPAFAAGGVGIVICLAIGACPTIARADDIAATCLTDYEEGQIAQKAGQFERARARFANCMRAECPRTIQGRCGILAQNIEAAQPSTLVVAQAPDGHDVVGARVSLDGQAAVRIPVTATRLDPGEHVVRVEADGFAASEQRFILREGEKDRRIEVALHPVGAPATEQGEPPRPEAGPAPGPIPASVWILGGVAAASLVGAAATGAIGWSMRDHLASTCKPTCSSNQIAPVRTLWITAFVALGVGVVTGSAAAFLFVNRHDPPATTGRAIDPGADPFALAF